MTKSERQSLSDALGGHWFLNLRALAWVMPFSISTSVLVSGTNGFWQPDPATRLLNTAQLLAANIIAIAACAILAFTIERILSKLKLRSPTPFFLVILIGAALGLCKGTITGLASWMLGSDLDLEAALSGRMLSSAILGAWLVPSVAGIAHNLEKYRQERDTLIAERVALALESSSSETDLGRRRTLDEVAKLLTESNHDSGGQYSQTIRQVIEQDLRPLSHKLWQIESSRWNRYSLGDNWRLALTNFPFAPAFSSLAYGATAFMSQLRYSSIPEVLARSLLAAFLVFTIFYIATRIFRGSNRILIFRFLSIPLIASVLIFFLSSVIFGQIDAYPTFETIATIWIWLLQLSLFGSLYLEIRSSRDRIRTALSVDSEQTLIDRKTRIALAKFTNREFANLLHGQVQNQLLALALQLEAGLSDENDARRRVLDIIAVAHNHISKTADPNVKSRLQELVEQWRAFAKISIDSDFEIRQLPDYKQRLVVQVVEEGIANSIRHGLANRVEVRLCREGEKLRISVKDNGLGPRTGKPGLGSELFQAASPNNWKISTSPEGGAVLHLSL